ncbi:hypothetical protein QAD02_024396 [Eretmocerus hayati]|uniref:Uncharacterized protein n=1 Tax=Eretmocerus hayati TaxID=131215 RepID=A0ACC2Q0S3_9HYME|nr:hypothetical protein QAD02_024396 [Eretmocerus hayati]
MARRTNTHKVVVLGSLCMVVLEWDYSEASRYSELERVGLQHWMDCVRLCCMGCSTTSEQKFTRDDERKRARITENDSDKEKDGISGHCVALCCSAEKMVPLLGRRDF